MDGNIGFLQGRFCQLVRAGRKARHQPVCAAHQMDRGMAVLPSVIGTKAEGEFYGRGAAANHRDTTFGVLRLCQPV